MKNAFTLSLIGLLLSSPVHSATFVINTNVTTAQTLANGETGTINAGGSLATSGGTAGITMSGTSQLTNSGTLQQTGTGRTIDNNTANANLTITNTGTITTASSDAIRVNQDSAISLINSGTINVAAGNGGQALDWRAITTKANSVTNQSTGIISDTGEDAIRPGVNGIVNNAGSITATPVVSAGAASGSDGIDGGTLTGIQVTNTGSISGRHGITGGLAATGNYAITINNNAGTISGVNGSGINIDGVFTGVAANVTNALGATIKGGVLAAATNGDGDGVDVDGILTLNNSGDILGYGAKGVGADTLPNNSEAVSIGGGSITNNATGRIIGSSLLADAPNGDATRAGNGILADNSSGGSALSATTVNNSGLIQGKTGYAVKFIGTFANTITNNSGGIIRGAGTGAAIQTGDGNDTINNSGSIVSDIGNAIDMQGGNNTLNVLGGSASISGNISGGTGGTSTMSIDPGTGQSFSFAHQINNFASVEIKSGTVTLASTSSVNASTTVRSGALLVAAGSFGGNNSALTVESGGTLKIGTTTADAVAFTSAGQSLVMQNDATLAFDLGGTLRGSGYSYITGLTNFTLPTSGIAAHITLTYLPSWTPQVGESFDLMDWSSLSSPASQFDFTPAPLGFVWNTSSFLSTGSISLLAAPEPGRALLLGLGSLSLVWRRRREAVV